MTDNDQEYPKKRTGLGFLLARTEPEYPKTPQKPIDTEQPSSPNAPEPETEVQSLKQLGDRCTIYLDRDINAHLDFVSRIECKRRSQIVCEILRAYLPKYSVTKE
jgi:hypothetical protein